MTCPTCAQVRAIMAIPTPSTPADDDVDEFIRLHCVIDPEATITAKGLYQAYYGWAAVSGHRVLSINKFGMMLQARGFQGRRAYAGERWRDGISLKAGVPVTSIHRGDPEQCQAVPYDPYAEVALD